MLWDIIHDFFVMYVFGGTLSDGEPFSGYIGSGFYTDELFIKLGSNFVYDGGTAQLSIGDYMSTIATIISMVVIVLICCAFIKKVYNIFAHVIG